MIVLEKKTKGRRPHNKTRTGCETCKRRRVKCDEARPSCRKCEASGRKCEGYNPPKAWIFQPDSKDDESSSSSPEENARPDSLPNDGRPSAVSSQMVATICKSNQIANLVVSQDGATTQSFHLDWTPAYRDPLFGHLLTRFVTSNSSTISRTTGTTMGHWAVIGTDTARLQGDGFLSKSLMSASLIMISQLENSDMRYRDAAKAYQDTLPELRRAIIQLSQDQSDSLRKDLILACVACSFSEILMGSWFNSDAHIEGVAVLINTGGPELLEDKLLRRLILEHRSLWVGCCFIKRRSVFYCREDWLKAIPVYDDPFTRGPLQKLCTLAYSFLPLIPEYDKAKDFATTSRLLHFLARLKQHETAFANFRTDDRLPATSLLPASFDALPGHQRVWLMELESKKLEAAITVNYLACFSIYLNILVLGIAEKLEVTGRDTSAIARNARTGILQSLNEIFQTVYYCMNGFHGLEAYAHVMFVLDTVWQGCSLIKHTPPDIRRAVQNISNMLRRVGYRPFREPWMDLFAQLSVSD